MSFEEPTPEERPFVEAILADPDDDGPRLVYGDWLSEQGDPRGEFVHVQCRLDSLPMDDPSYVELEVRERALLKQHRAKWIKPLPRIKDTSWGTYSSFRPGRWHFRRGLVEFLTVSKPKGFTDNPGLFEERPIRYVTFREMSGKLADALPTSSAAPRLRGLSLPIRHTDDVPLPVLDAERFPGLTDLSVEENSLESGAFSRLLDGFADGRLRALNIAFNSLVAAHFDQLLAWKGLPGLRSLNIGLNHELGPAMTDLTASEQLANLHELNLWGNDLDPEHAVAIANSRHLGRLVRLNLNRNKIGDDGLAAIATSDRLTSFRSLDLGYCGITDRGINALAGSAASSSITELFLTENSIGDAGARSIAESPNLKNLRLLDLASQAEPGISAVGLRAFAESPYLANIEFLNLGDAALDDDGRTALKKRFRKAFTDNPFGEPWMK